MSGWVFASLPVALPGGLTFGSVSAGPFYSCGVTAGQVVYCWNQGSAVVSAPYKVLGQP